MLGQLKSEGGCQRPHRGGEKARRHCVWGHLGSSSRGTTSAGALTGSVLGPSDEGEQGGQGRGRTQTLWGL